MQIIVPFITAHFRKLPKYYNQDFEKSLFLFLFLFPSLSLSVSLSLKALFFTCVFLTTVSLLGLIKMGSKFSFLTSWCNPTFSQFALIFSFTSPCSIGYTNGDIDRPSGLLHIFETNACSHPGSAYKMGEILPGIRAKLQIALLPFALRQHWANSDIGPCQAERVRWLCR